MAPTNIPDFYEMKEKERTPLSSMTKNFVLWAHDEECVYCGQEAQTVDHFVPVYRNGDDDHSNLVAACQVCNMIKSNLKPEDYCRMYNDGDVSMLDLAKIGEIYYMFNEIIFAKNMSTTEKHIELFKNIESVYPYEFYNVSHKIYLYEYIKKEIAKISSRKIRSTVTKTLEELENGIRNEENINSVGKIYLEAKEKNDKKTMILSSMINIFYFMERSNPWKASARILSLKNKNIVIKDENINEIFDSILDMRKDSIKKPFKKQFEETYVRLRIKKGLK